MTSAVVEAIVRSQRPARARDEEVDELHALTAHLPQLVRGWSAPVVVDGALRLDAALWALACRHGVDLGPEATVIDAVDGLGRRGWSTGPARDALRAFVMLHDNPDAAPYATRRLLAYLELRCRFG